MLLANIFESVGTSTRLLGDLSIKIKENDQRAVMIVIGRMRRRIERRNYTALKDTIHDMEDLGMNDDAIAEALSTVKPEILAWFEMKFAARDVGRLTNVLIHQVFLLVDIGITWPELARILETNKQTVIKALLQYLQQNVQDSIVLMHIRGYIERFTRLGIRWPELVTIWNSLMKELKDQDLDEDTQYDDFIDDLQTTMPDAKFSSDDIDKCLQRLQSSNFAAIQDTISVLTDLGLRHKEITNAIKTKKSEVMAWLMHQLTHNNDSTLGYVVTRQICQLAEFGITWPEMTKVLDAHKHQIVYNLLSYLKNTNGRKVFSDLHDHTNDLGKIGLAWPELQIIQRSMEFELKIHALTENIENRPDWYDGFVDYIGDTNITAAVYTAKAAGVNMHNSELLATHLNDWKWYLLRYFERCLGLSFQGFEEIHKEIKLLKSIGVDWPELDTYWDDNKEKVMRQLLMTLKMEDEDAGFYTWQEINALRQAGVRWPELDIVMRGAMDMMGRKENLEEHDHDDSYADAEDARYANFAANFAHGMEEFSTDLSDLGDLIYGFEGHGVRERDIDNLIKDNLPALIAWFEENVDSNSPDSIADFLHCLDQAGAIDDVRMIIDNHLEHRKDEIVTWILTSIRQMKPETGASRIFSHIFRWPELDIINRSIDADYSRSIRESEDENAKLKEEGRQLIIDLLRKQATGSKRGIHYAMYHIDDWGLHLKDWPELRKMIDEQKHQIIYDMLKSFKDATEIDLAEESARFAIARMKKIGVDWPELDMIDRSVRKKTDQKIREERGNRDQVAMQEFRSLCIDLAYDIANESWDLVAFDLIDIGMTDVKGAIPPHLKDLIETNKHNVIRGMLERMKVSKYTEMTMYAITALHDMGIDWPELMIMHKSLISAKKDQD